MGFRKHADGTVFVDMDQTDNWKTLGTVQEDGTFQFSGEIDEASYIEESAKLWEWPAEATWKDELGGTQVRWKNLKKGETTEWEEGKGGKNRKERRRRVAGDSEFGRRSLRASTASEGHGNQCVGGGRRTRESMVERLVSSGWFRGRTSCSKGVMRRLVWGVEIGLRTRGMLLPLGLLGWKASGIGMGCHLRGMGQPLQPPTLFLSLVTGKEPGRLIFVQGLFL
eukprot:g59749.t1